MAVRPVAGQVLMDPATVQLIERDNALPELAVLGAYRVRGREIFVKLAYCWTGEACNGWSAFAPDAKHWAGYVSEGVPIWRRKQKPSASARLGLWPGLVSLRKRRPRQTCAV